MGSSRSIFSLFMFLSYKQTHILHLAKLWAFSAHEIYASHFTGESALQPDCWSLLEGVINASPLADVG